ncbi:MAG: GNAT family N-acetyltransferase [Blautia sp.]|nr:GNAT family N-acetyltransferase [Blautia sp.]
MYDYSRSPALRGIFAGRGKLDKMALDTGGVPLYILPEEELSAGRLAWALCVRGYSPPECLLLAANDAELLAANALQMAACAYVDEAYPNQSYAGAGMVIEGFEEVDGEFLLRIFQRYHHIPWIITRTKRCVIRELAPEDIGELIDLYDTPGITCRMGQNGEYLPGYIEPLYPLEEELEYQKNYIAHMYRYHGYGMWLVFEKESGALIGRAGLENREYPQGVELELGYLLHPDWQGRGIATEVCSAIIDYAREYLECEKLNLLTEEENLPSVALAERLGFTCLENTDISGKRTRRYVLHLIGK